MLNKATEKILSQLISLGAALTTVFLISGSVTDPVNAPKLLVLGIFSFAAFGVVISASVRTSFMSYKAIWITSILFLIFAALSLTTSKSPFSQGVYGTYGRNNGFLAYLFLASILLASVNFLRVESFRRLIYGFFFAGIVNIVYCLWVVVFGDFIGWNNPYGNILGTLGNPNFIGAFLGMFIAAYFAYGISSQSSKYFKLSMILVIPITGYEIVDSNAIQGRVVGAVGFAIVGFFYVRSKFNVTAQSIYSAFCVFIGFAALLGALQIGPLTSIIYKTSVSLRGQYWLAGWNTGQSHPFFGAGMDAFGDWYRRSRDIHALELPGVNVVVNASHNVPLDMFAFGGWPLFISYLSIMTLGGLSLVRAMKRIKHFDPILVVLTVLWVGYQLQSIISINQIGLAIWGWTLTGASIAFERITRTDIHVDKLPKGKLSNEAGQNARAILTGAALALTGLILALPPLTSDSAWRSAQVARSVEKVEESMTPSYFNTQNSMKYLTNIQTLESSGFFELSHLYALEATTWNPESFDLWKVLYLVKNSTQAEKELALKHMTRLDPLNPNVTSIE